MTIAVQCAQCGQQFAANPQLAGKTVKCKCGAPIHVPPIGLDQPLPGLEGVAPPRSQIPAPLSQSQRQTASTGPKVPYRMPERRPPPRSRSSNGTLKVLGILGGVGALALLFVCGGIYMLFSIGRNRAEAKLADARAPYPVETVSIPSFTAPHYRSFAGVQFAEVHVLGPTPRALWVYLPAGSHEQRELPCVLIAPAGTNLLTGMKLGDGDRAEHLPYVKAGFAVVAYSIDGPMPEVPESRLTDGHLTAAYRKFKDAYAGVANARVALEYVLKEVPEVDPQRIYCAGHSSAGTLALLFAEHEPRLAGCAAFAPCSDIEANFKDLTDDPYSAVLLDDVKQFVVQSSPRTHAEQLNCPLLLFHAINDQTIPHRQSVEFEALLRSQGKSVQLKTVSFGGHYESMIQAGIPAAIEFFKQHNARPKAASRGPLASNTPPARTVPQPSTTPRSTPPFGGTNPTRPTRGPTTTSPSRGSAIPSPKPPVTQPPTRTTTIPRSPTQPSTIPRIPRPKSYQGGLIDEWNVSIDAGEPVKLQMLTSRKVQIGKTYKMLFPAQRGRAVMLQSLNQDRIIMDFQTGRKIGALNEVIRTISPVAISPSGKYLAIRIHEGLDRTHVFDTSNGREVCEVDHGGGGFLGVMMFSSEDRLLTMMLSADQARVWEIPNGKMLHELRLPRLVRKETAALSPGGRYFALICDQRLWVGDLQSGETAGDIALPEGISRIYARGMAFSPDGSELAAWFQGTEGQLVCWNVADGQVKHELSFRDRIQDAGYDGPSLDWIGDRGWLVGGTHTIDRTGNVSALPTTDLRNRQFPRRMIDDKRLLTVGGTYDAHYLQLINLK